MVGLETGCLRFLLLGFGGFGLGCGWVGFIFLRLQCDGRLNRRLGFQAKGFDKDFFLRQLEKHFLEINAAVSAFARA